MTWIDGPRCDGCNRQLDRARYVLEDLTTGDVLPSCGHQCLARIAAKRTFVEDDRRAFGALAPNVVRASMGYPPADDGTCEHTEWLNTPGIACEACVTGERTT